jgi:hypothetical protein
VEGGGCRGHGALGEKDARDIEPGNSLNETPEDSGIGEEGAGVRAILDQRVRDRVSRLLVMQRTRDPEEPDALTCTSGSVGAGGG